MQRLYTAANLPEAYLLLHMLQAEGIAARVFNENAQGGVGELPFTHTYPEIWVERETDAGAARAVIRRFEDSMKQGDAAVTCPRCEEENPGSFDVCWNCGTALS
jgi:hypothetical protein